MLALVRPLYQRMVPTSFAADAAKARKAHLKAQERLAAELEKAKGGGGKSRTARVDADDFNETAGISKQAAARVRKQQIALAEAEECNQHLQAQFEQHVAAMQQSVDGNYSWHVTNMLSALVEFYEFVHAKAWLADAFAADAGVGPAVTAAVQQRKVACMERSMALAKDIVAAIGVAREQTYIHDLVYGLHRIFEVVLHPLLAGMQGCEHVNKLMKQTLTSQCTAALNNRYDADGKKCIGDVAQVAHAKVVRTHIIETRGDSLPRDLYSQMLMGSLNWGSRASQKRLEKRDHKVFEAKAAVGLRALREGMHSPQTEACASPVEMVALLSDPPRKKRMPCGPTPLRPDFMEPEPDMSKS